MDLLKVLRLRHIRKGPARGRSFRKQRAFRQNFGAEQPGTLLRDRTDYVRVALMMRAPCRSVMTSPGHCLQAAS
jgi:hypothetical protein